MKTKNFFIVLAVIIIACNTTTAQIKDIVLVHGAFTDGSGWKKVFSILKSRGYNVSIVNHPNTGVEEDVAATLRVLDRHRGPVIMVGHSYGGAIITEAGNSPKVAGLVYVAAFAPGEGESLKGLLGKYPANPSSGVLPPVDGFVWYDRSKYHQGLCADLPGDKADFIAASQVPIAVNAYNYVFKNIAWKTKPSWYVMATEDKALSTQLQQYMGHRTGGTISSIKGSHFIFISQARKVARIIEAAAKGI